MRFHKLMLPYQREGIRFALARRGTLIADEMGLGKTVQAIGVIMNLGTGWRSILIICPASLIQNWKNEMRTWLPPGFPVSVEVISYQKAKSLAYTERDLVIVDEAHRIKNPDSKQTEYATKHAKLAKKVLLLTGSPMPNGRPIELWPLLCILDPAYWNPNGARNGTAFDAFRNQYCDPKYICINWRHKDDPRAWRTSFDGASNLEELNARLNATVMIRRMKKDVLTQLPDKRVQVLSLPYTAKAANLFEGFDTIEDYDLCIKKLRSDRVLFEQWSKTRHEQALDKVPYVIEHVESLLGEEDKVVVFAHHSDVIRLLADKLVEYDPIVITGETPIQLRQDLVVRFQTKKSTRVFIGSITAAGVGFTLTASANVVFAELDPVPGNMSQAADRCHRIGQKESVLVQHLVMDHSLDAHLVKLLVRKQGNIDVGLRASDSTSFESAP